MDLFTVIAALGALTLLFILFSKWRYQYWSRKGIPQLEPKLIFGDFKPLADKSKTQQDYFMEIYKTSKANGWKHVGIYNFLNPEFMTLDLNVVKSIMSKDFDHFRGHGFYHHKGEPLTENLFNMEGEEWKNLRAKLTPTFTSGKMKMMFETLADKANVLHRVLKKSAESDKDINIKDLIARFGTDVIGSVAFGIECNSLEDSDNRLRAIGRKVFKPNATKFFIEEIVPYWLLAILGYKTWDKDVTKYFTEIVSETIKYREANKVDRKDFMHLMLQLKNQSGKVSALTDQEIITEAYLFYIAGFETSSTTITFTLLELAHNQDVQNKLREEINEVLKQHGGKITYDAVMQMEYLDKVLHEGLRKYPPLAFIPRVCSKRYQLPGTDTVIDKGTRVFVPAWGIHMDPEYYPNPHEFNPENFSKENKLNRPDFTWLPFGEGPRMCIGLRFGQMQAKVGLVTLVKDFKVSSLPNATWPLEMEFGSLVLSPTSDMVRVEKL